MRNRALKIDGTAFIVALLMLCCNIMSHASSQPPLFHVLERQPSSWLLSEGLRYANDPAKPDSALLTLSVLVNRYDKKAPKAECLSIAKAYTYQAFVYIFRYYDYAKAYECLLHAKEISEAIGCELPSVYLNFGHIFSSIGEQSGDRTTMTKALWYMRKAFRVSLAEKKHNLANIAFGNAMSLAWNLNRLNDLEKEWKIYCSLKNTDSEEFVRFNTIYYKALLQLRMKHYDNALRLLDSQVSLMPEDASHVRYVCLALFNKARVYAMLHDYQAGISNLKSCLALGIKFDLKDVNLETCQYISDYYTTLGNRDSMIEYRNRYFSLKDTLIGYQQVASIKEMSFMDDLRKVNNLMAENRQRQQRLFAVSLVLSIIVLVICVFLVILYRKNRQLRSSYQKLFNKNQDVLRLEEKNKQLRSDGKYKNSNLADDEKQRLFEKIEQTLSADQSIYLQNFTLAQLSQLVGSNYKKVSQVINEMSGGNFNMLLNEYRIKEACRRINDEENYLTLTLEAIAESVGFKSRSTFLQAFKRFTGLTPSEYIRIRKDTK